MTSIWKLFTPRPHLRHQRALGLVRVFAVMATLLSVAPSGFAQPVNVPDVVGQAQASAEAAILGAGLVVGIVTNSNHPTVPLGDVISQNPVAGTSVPTGSSVDIEVSLGPAPVNVPNVVGQTQAQATTTIANAGLNVGTVTQVNDPAPAGDVIDQSPASGTSVPAGSDVDITVSLGPVLVNVPDVVGLPQATAEADIVAANLMVGTITTANSNTVPAGNVISQDPAAGASVQENTPVDLVVSSGALPVAVDDAYTTNEDMALVVPGLGAPSVLANDTDPDMGPNPLTAQLVSGPANGTLSPTLDSAGGFTYTPNANFNGLDTFTYQAFDGTAFSNIATVRITVNSVNDLPTAVDDNANTPEDTSRAIDVLANDTDIDIGDTKTIIAVGTPDQGGSVSIIGVGPDNTLSYTPALNFPAPNPSGIETFTYTMADGAGATSTATVTMTVSNVNDAPVGGPLPDETATENIPFVLDLDPVTPIYTDADGDTLDIQIVGELPNGLTFDSGTTIISGMPVIGVEARDYPVDVIVSDGIATLVDPFVITVFMAGRADLALDISAVPGPALVGEAATWTFDVVNRSAEDVVNISVDATFSGQVPFTVNNAQAGCMITPQGSETLLNCVAGPVAGGESISLQASGVSSQAGDVLASGNVSIRDPIPIDSTPDNDDAIGTLNVAQTLSGGAAQKISSTGNMSSAGADLNGDGFVDLLVATASGDSSLILPSVVDPADADKRALSDTPVSLGDQGPGTAVAAADLDGDGAIDIVTAYAPGAANRIFMNLDPGDGSFSFAPADELGATTDDSRAIAIGEIDGAIGPDIVFANGSPNLVFLNTGGGAFAAPDGLGDRDSVDVALVDLIGDSLPELVFANSDGDATVYRNTGGQFTPEPDIPTGPSTSVATGDFDGDGDADLVFGRAVNQNPGEGPSNLVLLNTSVEPMVSFFQASELGISPTVDVLTEDTDLDGDIDIVSLNSTGGHQIFVNNGVGEFTLHPEQFATPGALGFLSGQFSVDNRMDVVVTSTSGNEVFLNDGQGNFGLGDTGLPVVQLLGPTDIQLAVEDAFVDPGATATDAIDGDLTAGIVIDNPVDTAVVGTYTVTYTVKDSSGNTATPVTRTVAVGVNTPVGGGGGGAISPWLLGLLTFLAGIVTTQRRSRRLRSRS